MSINLSNYELAEIFQINNTKRDNLLKMALKQPSKFEQIKYIADYFTNLLSLEEIAFIDGTTLESTVPFIYDYSFLEDYKNFARTQQLREFTPGGFAPTIPVAIIEGHNNTRIYPSIYALKMATCHMFASEIDRFCKELDIKSDIVNKITPCYDHFDGTNDGGEEIHTDYIVNMDHYYNILDFDGTKLKLDIAGILTAIDYNLTHPDRNINLERFYFSEDIHSNPFEEELIFQSNNTKNQTMSNFVSILLPN